MKKALLWLFLLTIPFTFGCPSPRNDNAVNTNAANTNTGNTNQGINPDRSDKKNKAIQIAVYEVKENGVMVKKVAITPQSIYISRGKKHHLRFSAFNGLEVGISKIEVTIEHKSDPSKQPFKDGDGPNGGKTFVIEDIKAGEEDDNIKGFREVINDPQYDGYYTIKIKVYVENQPQPITTIDTCPDTGVKFYAPQIEIGG